MDKTSEKLTVYFEEPFWVGVFERVDNNKLSVCKVTFGAEPKDYEIWEFILKYYYDLKFSPVVETEIKQVADNPKRRSRNARKQVKNTGIGTKSQHALKLQQEESKVKHRQISKEQRDTEKQRQFELKQQKRREKHRGH